LIIFTKAILFCLLALQLATVRFLVSKKENEILHSTCLNYLGFSIKMDHLILFWRPNFEYNEILGIYVMHLSNAVYSIVIMATGLFTNDERKVGPFPLGCIVDIDHLN
jgi:hypothetical protein